MKYVSTRGAAPLLDFPDVLLTGLAGDGGLYVPEAWPTLPESKLAALAGLPYAEAATRVMSPFVGHRVGSESLAELTRQAYAGFDRAEVCPLRPLDDGLWLLELFHGPTLAFKDVALQLLGRLLDAELSARGERLTLVGATSGDTGSAAIEACRDRPSLDVVILHPAGRVSEVQRRQMTTVESPNVHNLAVDGTFDDCQALVKALFADARLRAELRLGAVNSINWARVMAQIVYYVTAAAALGGPGDPVAFAVPTGNFGNVFAGYAAWRLGARVDHLVVGSNRNDILTRFLRSGEMRVAGVHPTLSPSMDIQVSSNVERLLFEVGGRDGAATAALMERFRATGAVAVPPAQLVEITRLFSGARLDDDETLAEMADAHRHLDVLVDPHTAVALGAARRARRRADVPMVVLATAHPAKFPDAVERATGVRPPLPPHLADLLERPERCSAVPKDLGAVSAELRRAAQSRP